MHIVFFTDNFPPEGNAIASRVFERACYWTKWGHQVTVITSVPNFPEGKVYPGYKNKFYQVETMAGIRVVRIKTFITKNKGLLLRTIDFISYVCPALIAFLWQQRPDIVIATTPQLFVGLTAWLSAAIKHSPFILEVADIWPAAIVGVGAMKKRLPIRWLERLELYLYKKSTAIVTLTAAFKENLVLRGISANKIHVVINGVELAIYTPQKRNHDLAQKYHIDTNQFVIGYIGTHGMAHALINVLRAAELLTSKDILLLFVGAGAERDKLVDYQTKNKLTNVKLLPAQPKEMIPAFWSLCDVALVHLKNDIVFTEVIPSKIFEAMGMGLPILLAAPKGEASKIILNNHVGMWVPAENPILLANAMNDYYLQPEKRKYFAAKSHESAYLYTREQQARNMLMVIEQVSPSIS